MASKTKVRIPLNELSVCEDSGWRSLEASHVKSLEETVRGGAWGQTTLVRPSVLQEGEKKCTSKEDGRYVLNNGLHAVKALMNVAAEVETMDESPIWMNSELAEIFSGGGLLVDVVEYSTQDRTARYAMQALAHEQDQNRYRPATLKNKVDLVSRIYNASTKDWSLVTKQLLDVLGVSQRSTVQRWVTLARDLDADVLTEIQAKRPTLPQSFVIGNKFLTGHGESRRFRLSAKYASVAIEWLIEVTEELQHVPSETFVNEFCLPAKTLELWEQSTIKRFGGVADSFKPFHRVVQSLQKNGRARIIACIRQRMPLGGGGKTEPGTSVGIEECKAVLDELSKMKAGASPKATEGQPALAESQGSDAAAAEPSCAADGDGGEYADLLTVDGDAGPAEDPLAKELQAEVSKQLVHVAIHSEKASFLLDCISRIVSDEKAIIYVETPSSKAKLACDFLKIASELPTANTAAVFVPVGGRLALLCNVAASVKKWFPGRQIFTVTIGADHQSARSRTSFGIYVPVPSVQRDVPSALSSAGCRATAIEGLRMRCKSGACRHRPAHDGDLDFQEVLPDDIPSDGEKDAADGFEEEVDGDDGEDVVEEDRGKAAGDATKVLANLFPVAFPVSLHLMILGALRATSMSHLFLLTRTPHPGLQVAARELGLEVVVLLTGPSSGRATRELHDLKIQGSRAHASFGIFRIFPGRAGGHSRNSLAARVAQDLRRMLAHTEKSSSRRSSHRGTGRRSSRPLHHRARSNACGGPTSSSLRFLLLVSRSKLSECWT